MNTEFGFAFWILKYELIERSQGNIYVVDRAE